MARNNTSLSLSGTSACENATQPASSNSAISVMRSPFSPCVSAPRGYTCAWLRLRARCLSISTSPGSSSGGSVSGGQTSEVTPPATAAAISLSSVALYSYPGSRNLADKSTSPGQTTIPVASMTRLAWKPLGAVPNASTLPAAMKTSWTFSTALPGSTTRPPLIWIFIFQAPTAEETTSSPGAHGHVSDEITRLRAVRQAPSPTPDGSANAESTEFLP